MGRSSRAARWTRCAPAENRWRTVSCAWGARKVRWSGWTGYDCSHPAGTTAQHAARLAAQPGREHPDGGGLVRLLVFRGLLGEVRSGGESLEDVFVRLVGAKGPVERLDWL